MTEIDRRPAALVLIDMAHDFVDEGGTIADAGGAAYRERARGIVPRLARLVEAARAAGVTVIYATDSHTPGDVELKKWPPHAMRGTRWAEILPEIAPAAGDLVLPKTTYSAFQSTDLEARLAERGIGRLYITGLHTDCCCRHTSGDAFQKGIDLVWITDALQAFTEEAHQGGLDYYKIYYATEPDRQFKTTDEVVAEWRQLAEAA
jgi:nicotinamidase-related amidase